MQKEGDAGGAICANFFQLCFLGGFARNFLPIFVQFCFVFSNFLHVFAHLLHSFLVQIFQTQSCVSAIFQFICNSGFVYLGLEKETTRVKETKKGEKLRD